MKRIFVGYAEGTKGYRLLDTITDRISISRDVAFIESDPHRYPTATDNQESSQQSQASEDNEVEIEYKTIPDKEKDSEGQTEANEELRRSTRIKKRPERLIETVSVATEIFEPKTFTEAIDCKKSFDWKRAMNCEKQSLKQNQLGC